LLKFFVGSKLYQIKTDLRKRTAGNFNFLQRKMTAESAAIKIEVHPA